MARATQRIWGPFPTGQPAFGNDSRLHGVFMRNSSKLTAIYCSSCNIRLELPRGLAPCARRGHGRVKGNVAEMGVGSSELQEAREGRKPKEPITDGLTINQSRGYGRGSLRRLVTCHGIHMFRAEVSLQLFSKTHLGPSISFISSICTWQFHVSTRQLLLSVQRQALSRRLCHGLPQQGSCEISFR